MAEANAINLMRLKEEQEKALIETEHQLEQWNKFRSDYVAVRDRLKTLPNKTTHNVMVPFGSLAFMPGQLVHTNEILALLGENYFVECSAVQAADIVTRRLKKLDENIQDLQKEREILTPRVQFTSEMLQMASGEGEQQEIIEEYDEEKEQQWKERHREYLRRASEREVKERAENGKKAVKKGEKTDTEYWDILDLLEQQENEREEIDRMEEDEDSEDEQQSKLIKLHQAKLSARYAEEEEEEYSSSLSESEETDGEEEDENSSDDEEEEELESHRGKVITFSHTKQQEDTSDNADPAGAESSDDSGDIAIRSPADLYRLVKTEPKSILKAPSRGISPSDSRQGNARRASLEESEKKVTFSAKQSAGERDIAHGGCLRDEDQFEAGDGFAESEEASAFPGKLTSFSRVQPFTETVVERQTTATTTGNTQQSRNSNSASQATQPVVASSDRPVSKFRAGRQKVDALSRGAQLTGSSDSRVVAPASQGAGDVSSSSTRPVSKFRASRMKQGGGS